MQTFVADTYHHTTSRHNSRQQQGFLSPVCDHDRSEQGYSHSAASKFAHQTDNAVVSHPGTQFLVLCAKAVAVKSCCSPWGKFLVESNIERAHEDVVFQALLG